MSDVLFINIIRKTLIDVSDIKKVVERFIHQWSVQRESARCLILKSLLKLVQGEWKIHQYTCHDM